MKILRVSLLCIIFSPISLVCLKRKPPTNPTMEFYYCAYRCLCLSECIFSWLESQVLRAGSKEKPKLMKVYFVLYKCWEVLAISIFFFCIFPPPFKSHWSFNKFLLKCPGRTVKCLHPIPPQRAWEDGGVERYISLACLSLPSPIPILSYFSWKELVRTSQDGVVWIVGGKVRVLSKLFNVPFSSSSLSLLKSIQRLLSHLF